MELAVDTETNGVDTWHGCGPFMITACDGESNYYWYGKVNPYDRTDITWEIDELKEVQDLIDSADKLIFHNAKFDIRMLSLIGITIPWDKVEDTMVMAHLVCSGDKMGLKYLAYKYLGYRNKNEVLLKQAVLSTREANKDYDLARKNHPSFPGIGSTAKGVSWYKMDYWLCLDECIEYGVDDVEMTFLLYMMFSRVIERNKQQHLYRKRIELLETLSHIEDNGVFMYEAQVKEQILSLKKEKEYCRSEIQNLVGSRNHLDLTKDATKKMLFFNLLGLVPLEYSEKTGEPLLNKHTIKNYIDKDPNNKILQLYNEYTICSTQIGYLNSYLKWVCDDGRIHTNFLLTGTRETRQASKDPNLQNIDKRLNPFGPPPGKVWVDFDLVNIEMRIWVYEVGNKELVNIFEKGGSVHMAVAETLHPTLYQLPDFKDMPEYGEVKAGNFAIIYGASEYKGNLTYNVENAVSKIIRRFPEIGPYSEKVINECWANEEKYGIPFVTTLVGYPLEVPVNDIFKACNYKIQGTAGFIMGEALVRVRQCAAYLNSTAMMVNTVHDSLKLEVDETELNDHFLQTINNEIEKAGTRYLPTCEAEYKIIRPQVSQL